ncbi:MAG: hypothetical protein FWD68_04685 [Alphaproteobacteria bacterium]|nr:hypothetical protein [Alphaproteobacteria bacterium]
MRLRRSISSAADFRISLGGKADFASRGMATAWNSKASFPVHGGQPHASLGAIVNLVGSQSRDLNPGVAETV